MQETTERIGLAFGQGDLNEPKAAARAIKRQALAFGADAVGIGNIERWKGAPLQMDPKQIMPECKSISAWSFRSCAAVCAASRRALFQQLLVDGLWGIRNSTWPMTVINLSKFIDDRGFEAIANGPPGFMQPRPGARPTTLGFMRGKFAAGRPRAGRAPITVTPRPAALPAGLARSASSRCSSRPSSP
jgi:hypothetical protein